MDQELRIEAANVGRRLETVIRQWLPQVPRTRLLMWLRKGLLRHNGRRAKPELRLAEGDVLRLRVRFAADAGADVALPAAGVSSAKLPAPIIVYEDDDLLVLDKPAGLAAHPGIGHGHDSLSARIEAYLGSTDAPVGQRPGLAQRLDAGVSGLLPAGKHARALKVLMGPPHGPKIDKIYLAVVTGEVEGEGGRIDLPLRSTDAPRGDVPKVVVDRISGKPARTDYVVLRRFARRSLLALRLHTGRTHQIRAHLRALGHPLLGDPRYGAATANAWAHATFGVERPLLHAAFLHMAQPLDLRPLHFALPLPVDMARLCGGQASWPDPFVPAEA